MLVDEGAVRLADFGRELAAILRDMLVIAIGPVDLPVGLLQRLQQPRCAKNLGAVLRDPDVRRGGMLAVDRGPAVAMGSPTTADRSRAEDARARR